MKTKTRILQNQARCNKCGDEPYSAHRHDYVQCKCGAIAVDGGLNYIRRVGELGAITEMSIVATTETVDACVAEIHHAISSHRNELGILCAVMRTLRDRGYDLTPPDIEN